MSKNIHPVLKNMIPIIQGIAKTFGRNCEVVLQDLSNPQKSVVAIVNGHVTGRDIGSPLTERGLKAVRNKEYETDLIKYKTVTSDGRTLKSSTIFIKDEKDKVIGCMCINYDITEFVVAKKVINEMVETLEDSIEREEETYSNNINDILYTLVDKVLGSQGKPIAYLNKEEKVNIVKQLDEKGTFLIKGAVEYVAEVLCVSRFTVYNYLDEIRSENY
ncbi:PAS domain-containing protein [Clostridiaceae bacterium M8S5]|nr:PAS domain-containing protein [Clostridiaceae bacterium M8S5]